MNKSYKYLPAGIALFAALVVSILMLVNKVNSLKALILVFAFLLVFYIAGLIFRAILIKFETKPAEHAKEEEQTENISTESEEEQR
ncbi:MAG: hypothetical protein ACI4EN_09315 [Butyrivibrio sp.]